MNHAELVERAVEWLRFRWGSRSRFGKPSAVILVECGTVGEAPDAIAWDTCGRSALVECKATRPDFLADKAKPFRKDPSDGLGNERWYMTPPRLVSVDELPERWGLLEVHPRIVRIVRKPVRFDLSVAVERREKWLLVSAARRALEGFGTRALADARFPIENASVRLPGEVD